MCSSGDGQERRSRNPGTVGGWGGEEWNAAKEREGAEEEELEEEGGA